MGRMPSVAAKRGLTDADDASISRDRSTALPDLLNIEQSLRAIVDSTTAVIYVKDLSGRYLLINSQFERLFDVSREQIRGQTDFDVFPREIAEQFRSNDSHVARSDETLRIEETAPDDDGPHTYISVKFPLHDEQGQVYAVAGISTDITDRVRAQSDADELRGRLELILNSINNGIVGLDGRGEVTFANPTAQQLLKCQADQMSVLMPSVAMDIATRPDDADVELIAPPRHESKLRRSDGTSFHAEYHVHPVVEQGRSAGAVFSFCDITDRKRREAIERQLQSARAVQQILYPREWPTCPGLDVAGHVYPAETMCGDYLDFIHVSDDELVIAVGDVSGHGFGPALQMVETRACLRAMLNTGHSLPEAVTALNDILLEDTPADSFITLFAAGIDLSRRTLRCVTAGHAAWLFRREGAVQQVSGEGIVLGIDGRYAFESTEAITLQSGDLLLIPTDGVQETQNPARELFGIDRMLATVGDLLDQSAVEIVDGLYHASIDFAAGRRQGDDVTIAVVKVV